ncbi:MAG: 2,3,4,5-tetrahydropyridine-2,6-dicarboxylate N-succinyltransferase [Deltaproteobacteria bacterium]|nr:2,3,4,5-tetrahydropyridine-2,6-dicarboxylate N-succinyltransferase [Deltaproteobacteria bacterium]
METVELEKRIGQAFEDRGKLAEAQTMAAVEEAIALLDKGLVRAAVKRDGVWIVQPWVKQAILLYFALRKVERIDAGYAEYHDKIPLKRGFAEAGVRVVPPGTARHGAFLERGAILMPGYVNIGAWVGSGTMIDTWATVGSCAQIGRDCHLAGGVGIGGVLEPPSARPVIVEDGCFIGSRSIIVEGSIIESEAILGANVVVTASTPIIDVRGSREIIHRGRVPARSVVIPGVRAKRFPAGEYGTPCALIIGERNESTDRKVTLEQALRDYDVAG